VLKSCGAIYQGVRILSRNNVSTVPALVQVEKECPPALVVKQQIDHLAESRSFWHGYSGFFLLRCVKDQQFQAGEITLQNMIDDLGKAARQLGGINEQPDAEWRAP
jgi:hypothetical protein